MAIGKMSSGGTTSTQWVKQGDEDFKQQNYQTALVAYEEALRLTSMNTGTSNSGASVPWRFKRSPEISDVKVHATFGKAEALRMLKRYDEAVTVYEQAIQIDSKNDFAYRTFIGKSSAQRGSKHYF